MSFYNDRVLPRVIDIALGKPFEETRARVASGLSGEVLEVGFGTGRNVPHYPSAVSRVQAVEPAEHGLKIAARRLAASPVPVVFVGTDGQDLPVADQSVDHVLVTWTLCTIPDVDRALREMNRVLKTGGSLHFVEHGRSPRESSARWQDRVTPLWGMLFSGCHLNRPIPELVEGAGFDVDAVRSYRANGPELLTRLYEGVAVKV